MQALVLALGATLLWSLTNLLDKGIVQRYGADGAVGALIIISALFPILMTGPSLVLAEFDVALPQASVAILLLSGACQVAWIGLYLKALQSSDVTVVMPLMALSPLFAWLAGMVVLSEFPASFELVGSAIILLSALILSYEKRRGTINYKLIATVSLASCLIAVSNALFKSGTAQETIYWAGLFWQSLGSFSVGIFIILLHRPTYYALNDFLQKNPLVGIGINSTNEIITLCGNALFGQALLLGKLMIIQSTEAFQPIFVFLLGTSISFFFPNHIKEDLSSHALIKKLVGISGVCAGSLVLFYDKVM